MDQQELNEYQQQPTKELEIITNRVEETQIRNHEEEKKDEKKETEKENPQPPSPQPDKRETREKADTQLNQSIVEPQKEEELDIFGGAEDESEAKSKYPSFQRVLDDNYFQIFITLLTVYALFGDDIRVIATDATADVGFDAITTICLIMFSIEIALASIAKQGYIGSFFFWLDFISTISLILDIQMLTNAFFYGNSGGKSNTQQIAQAGKASRVGTKAGRVVRLVRLIRIVKLYKAAQEAESQNQQVIQKFQERRDKKRRSSIHPQKKNSASLKEEVEQNISARSAPSGTGSMIQGIPTQNPPKQFKESRVSKRLSDLTTKRVIIIVLLLLFIMPLFSADYFFDPPTSIDYAIKHMQALSEKNSSDVDDIKNLYKTIQWTLTEDRVISPLVQLTTPFSYLDDFELPINEFLRDEEKESGSYDLNITLYIQNHPGQLQEAENLKAAEGKEGGLTILGVVSKRKLSVVSAGLSLGRTIFVCIVLTTGSLMFSKDATDLALTPIEKMIENVNKIARNPILAKELKLNKDDGNQMETIIIENAIIKIGSLLALGFGDAGCEIIGSNMARGGDVDPMLPGKKKCAIYGFCDIRNFTDATEQLQEDCILFVNNIGEVVHSMVDRYAGAANKNIGDAFLLVWKMPEDKYIIDESDNSVEFRDKPYVSILADFALISFMKIQAKLNRESKILQYRTEQRLLIRMKDYKVKLGFGLHYGWGIEGAIGSEFKIDASYLSPNVNMSGHLEASTKQFGVPLLISHNLQALFTPQLQRYTRSIDRVSVKGSNIITCLYTIDMVVDDLPPSKDPEGYDIQEKKELDKMKKMDMMLYLNDPLNNHWDAEDFIQSNKDLKLMMETWNEEFQSQFSDGFQAYLQGDWQLAKQKFAESEKIIENDGPTKNLMDIMGQHGFKAPSDWAGYRYDGGGH